MRTVPAAALAVGRGDRRLVGRDRGRPPATELTVQTVAISHARRGRARVIGTSRKSGGSGKNELSAKDISAIAAIA